MAKYRVVLNAMDSEDVVIEATRIYCASGCLLLEGPRKEVRDGETTHYFEGDIVAAFAPSAWVRCDEVKE